MARILITSGPTRQYIDPVRYLTNASSGRMGAALAEAALAGGHRVVIVSGPVHITYPPQAELYWVVTTDEMLNRCAELFPECDGLIGVAAPCDYQPERVAPHKLSKTGEPLVLRLIETPDIVATLGARKRPDQWVVGFALETEDHRFRAIGKMQRKFCDLMVLNSPAAMDATETQIEILAHGGQLVETVYGDKLTAARAIMRHVGQRLIGRDQSRQA
jgi:phosphopantothenoylcysteine decarboxylase/phosphopantothenate--cysteine ligase